MTAFQPPPPRYRDALTLATQLLVEAPITPGTRRATFGALATIAREGSAAVERGVDAPDGDGTAVRITFTTEAVQLPGGGTEQPGRTAFVLDTDTGDLLETTFDTGSGQQFTTTWSRPIRTASDTATTPA